MKRALSLIIVLAMVLCMVPFSAFAADFDTGTDLVDGTITLTEDAGYVASYLWTATEDGTLEINATGAEGTNIYIQVDGVDYNGAFEVTAGESYEITIGDGNYIGGDVEVYTVFTGLAGTETNPYKVYNPAAEGFEDQNTVTVPANTTVYCNLIYFGGKTVVASGEGVKIAYNGETYGSIEEVDGVLQLVDTAEFDVDAGLPMIDVKLSNKTESEQTYTFTQKAAEVGTVDNPEVVTDGTYTADLEAGNQGYYYSYTAEGDGTVSVSIAAADAEGNEIGWFYVVNNLTTGAYGDNQWNDSDPVVNPTVVEVAAGDKLQVIVNTYDPADMFNNPAGVVTTTFAFEEAAAAPAALVLGDNVNIAPGTYTYTATEAGGLSVAVTSLVADGTDLSSSLNSMAWFMNFSLYVNGAGDGSAAPEAVNVAVGDVVTIEFIQSLSCTATDVAATLTLTLGDEVVTVPGTTADTAIEIELPWSVPLEGEHDMYYKYTAAEDCIIKVTSTGYMSISGAEYKNYDEDTLYVEAAAGAEIIINPYVYGGEGSYTYTADIVDALPEGNGSSDFPIVIDVVPYEAANSGETTLYYTYTAAKAGTLTFSGTEYYVTLNGGWSSALDENNQVVVAEGDVIKVSIYPENSFAVDYMPAVAMIGKAEYTTIDAAVEAAVSGDTITLVADVTTEAGIVLPAGANLDLGEYSLEAPYVVAFSGSNVTGVVGSATITAANLVAGNVTISDVEYAWTATDGVYSLVEVAAETVADPVAKIGDVMYASVEEALNAAVSGETVTLTASPEETYSLLIIRPGVTLNIGTYTLKADTIVGVTGSYLTADAYSTSNAYGNLYVGEDNIVLSVTAPYNTSNSTYTIPFWTNDHFVFSLTKVSLSDQKVENGVASMTISVSWTGNVRTGFLAKNGTSVHEVSVVASGSWNTTQGRLNQDLVFGDDFVKSASASSSGSYSCSIAGADTKEKLVLTAKVVTDCGIVVSAPEAYEVN